MIKYISEFDQWLIRYRQQHPKTEQQQRQGRSRLWDKDPKEIDRPGANITNKQSGYVYYD
jgi:hypothetical protein